MNFIQKLNDEFAVFNCYLGWTKTHFNWMTNEDVEEKVRSYCSTCKFDNDTIEQGIKAAKHYLKKMICEKCGQSISIQRPKIDEFIKSTIRYGYLEENDEKTSKKI